MSAEWPSEFLVSNGIVHWFVLIPPAALMSPRNRGVDHQPTSLRQVTLRLFSSPIGTGTPVVASTWSCAPPSPGHARASPGAASAPAASTAAPPTARSLMKPLRSMVRRALLALLTSTLRCFVVMRILRLFVRCTRRHPPATHPAHCSPVSVTGHSSHLPSLPPPGVSGRAAPAASVPRGGYGSDSVAFDDVRHLYGDGPHRLGGLVGRLDPLHRGIDRLGALGDRADDLRDPCVLLAHRRGDLPDRGRVLPDDVRQT